MIPEEVKKELQKKKIDGIECLCYKDGTIRYIDVSESPILSKDDLIFFARLFFENFMEKEVIEQIKKEAVNEFKEKLKEMLKYIE
jgi:anaerobic ribonucleoside-triphosphate reductase